MKIKELIEKLEKFPEDSVVYIPCESYTCIPHVTCIADAVTDFIPSSDIVYERDEDGPRVMIY